MAVKDNDTIIAGGASCNVGLFDLRANYSKMQISWQKEANVTDIRYRRPQSLFSYLILFIFEFIYQYPTD